MRPVSLKPDAILRPHATDRRLWLVKPVSDRAKRIMADVMLPSREKGWYVSMDPLVGWMVPLTVRYEETPR